MIRFLKRLWPEEEAQNLSEYALIMLLVSLTVLMTMGTLASTINKVCSGASAHVVAASSHESITSGPLQDNNTINTKGPSTREDTSPRPN